MAVNARPSNRRDFAAKGRLMRRLVPLISCLMLALILFSGTAAHAVEAAGTATTSQALAHFDGDGDQVPADEHGAVPHHHGICHGDHIGLPAGLAPPGVETIIASALRMASPAPHPSAELGAALRPPIA